MRDTPKTAQLGWIAPAKFLPLLAFILIWWLVTLRNSRLGFFIGSPALYMHALIRATASGSLILDTAVTGLEAVSGFLVGNVIGSLVGLIISRFPRLSAISGPYIVALGAAPLFAFAPIIVVWFGVGFSSKVIVAAVSTLFVALTQSFIGASSTDPKLIEMARTFGATDNMIFRKVIAPSALVWVMNALRLTVGLALLGAFLGEFISSTNGLGHLILVSGGLYDIPSVLVGVSMLSALGLALSWLVDTTEPLLYKLISHLP
jgi:NitT/TauT family transport system permease protein